MFLKFIKFLDHLICFCCFVWYLTGIHLGYRGTCPLGNCYAVFGLQINLFVFYYVSCFLLLLGEARGWWGQCQ